MPAAAADGATAVEFDFASKGQRPIALDDAPAACDAGRFCWLDFDLDTERAAAEQMLRRLNLSPPAITAAFDDDVDGRYDLYDECLHLGASAAVPASADGAFTTQPVSIILGERFLISLRRGQAEFLDEVRRHCHQDFVRFARTPGFLLYELFDHLSESHKRRVHELERRVDAAQACVFAAQDDAIFGQVAGLTRELLSLRAIVLAARDVLYELSTRRSPFVAESAQPSLERLVGTLERLAADLTTQREILAETLNLYLGVVSHRTNRVVSRLTVLSMIFLPLTFLCGVYGMNFGEQRMPELGWQYGYAAFWAMAILIGGGLLTYMKLRRWW